MLSVNGAPFWYHQIWYLGAVKSVETPKAIQTIICELGRSMLEVLIPYTGSEVIVVVSPRKEVEK